MLRDFIPRMTCVSFHHFEWLISHMHFIRFWFCLLCNKLESVRHFLSAKSSMMQCNPPKICKLHSVHLGIHLKNNISKKISECFGDNLGTDSYLYGWKLNTEFTSWCLTLCDTLMGNPCVGVCGSQSKNSFVCFGMKPTQRAWASDIPRNQKKAKEGKSEGGDNGTVNRREQKWSVGLR